MRLLFTDEHFAVAGSPAIGIPFLLDRDMELVEEANTYLLYVALDRGMTRSPQTWRNHGEALYDYFSWLEAHGLDWRQGCSPSHGARVESAIAAYRNWSINLVDQESGRRRLKRTTINQRLTCLIGFYRWAVSRDLIKHHPWLVEMRSAPERPADFMRHAHAGQVSMTSDDLKLRTFVEPPKLLSLTQCRKLIEARMSLTHRLMVALMLQTGIRNEECRTFPRSYIFDPKGGDPRKRIRIDLRPEDMQIKFDKPRSVYVTPHLMMELHQYTRFGERVLRVNARAIERSRRQRNFSSIGSAIRLAPRVSTTASGSYGPATTRLSTSA
ncbi:hypothetical protein AWV80_00190 [Cupriavidus sp. UYMU48A]|nr:hypothetical protein AWV80_00190 [Cupriavidus sp. UYMU48A]